MNWALCSAFERRTAVHIVFESGSRICPFTTKDKYFQLCTTYIQKLFSNTRLSSVSLYCKSHHFKTANFKIISENEESFVLADTQLSFVFAIQMTTAHQWVSFFWAWRYRNVKTTEWVNVLTVSHSKMHGTSEGMIVTACYLECNYCCYIRKSKQQDISKENCINVSWHYRNGPCPIFNYCRVNYCTGHSIEL